MPINDNCITKSHKTQKEFLDYIDQQIMQANSDWHLSQTIGELKEKVVLGYSWLTDKNDLKQSDLEHKKNKNKLIR